MLPDFPEALQKGGETGRLQRSTDLTICTIEGILKDAEERQRRCENGQLLPQRQQELQQELLTAISAAVPEGKLIQRNCHRRFTAAFICGG